MMNFNSNYYKAILQNLFFASFNTKIDFLSNALFPIKKNHLSRKRYRYESLFLILDRSTRELFANIPFLNGGLFSNLDYKVNP